MTHEIINQFEKPISDSKTRNEVIHQVEVDNVNKFVIGEGMAEITSHKVDMDGNKITIIKVFF